MKENKEIRQKILDYLNRNVSRPRLNHILGVARTAKKLALIHKVDSKKAEWAGLLHDIARGFSDRELVRYTKRYRLRISCKEFLIQQQPLLLHAGVGADWVWRYWKIKDRDIISAISKHTFASEKMNKLDKILFVADFCAPDRMFPEVKKLRALASRNLDSAFVECYRSKLIYLVNAGLLIHPDSIKIWNQLFRK